MIEIPQNSTVYAVTMLFAGIGIPIMAASLSYLLLVEGIPISFSAPSTPFYYYLGGLFVVFYVLSVTWIAPRFGIGNAVSFVLLGQLLSMATIDQFGLMGAPQMSLTLPRLMGLFFMMIGVFLVVRK